MATWTVLEANGLHTTANPLSAVPRGAVRKADNCVVRSKDVYEPRRGQKTATVVGSGAIYERPNEVTFLGSMPVAAYGDGNLFIYDSGLGNPQFNGFSPPAPNEMRMKFAEANEKLFLATSNGIKSLDTTGADPITPGIPKPFSVDGAVGNLVVGDSGGGVNGLTTLFASGTPVRNWLDDDNQVSVRVAFAIRDDRNNVQMGPPTERVVLVNDTGSGSAVRVYIGLPSEITTDHLYRIFMTEPSGGDDIEPDDEHWLVYEGVITAGDIFAGYIQKDITNVEAVLSDVALYTNPNTGNGVEAARLQAPWAKDICYWNNCLWAFGVKRKQRFTLTLLGLAINDGSGSGLSVSDSVFLNGIRYKFNDDDIGPRIDSLNEEGHGVNGCWRVPAWEDLAEPSIGISLTARALVHAINLADPTLRASYSAKEDGWPGEIVIEETGIGGDPFTIYGNVGSETAWYPQLPTSAPDALESQADDLGHWVWYSEYDSPEAWPLKNFIPVGKRGANVLRGVPLKDGLFCWMDDGSIQVIRGRAGSFRVDTLDSTAGLIGPDTAKVLNNQIWALTDQGVVTVSDAGVALIGLPIEIDLAMLLGDALETTKLRSFAITYETERLYGIWLPERAGATYCSAGYVFNYVTKAWCRWTLPRNCGAVNPVTKLLYMGHPTEHRLMVERKSLTASDYADEEEVLSISTVVGNVVTLSSAASSAIAVGDAVGLDDYVTTVTEVTDSTHFVVADGSGLDVGATLYRAFESDIEYVPTALGAPGMTKEVSDFKMHFAWIALTRAQAWLSTDLSFAWSRAKEFGKDVFGSQEWGEFVWGDPAGPYTERMGVSSQKHSASFIVPRLQVREAFGFWRLLGYSLEYEGGAERTKR